jgi:uncharacterized protein YbjT (DUF2867 family)
MRVAVIGGTGMLGRRVGRELLSRGQDVRVLSRGSADHPVDLRTGDGLDEALAGCDVVIDAATGRTPAQARATLVDGGRRLLAAEWRAGVRHHVCASIVGCDLVPLAYFAVKTEQERVVEGGPVPWSIVRATQFHEFVTTGFDAVRRSHVLPVPGALVQTVACGDVARAIADIAEGEPRRKRIDVAGPEVVDSRALARTWRAIAGGHEVICPVRIPGRLGRRLRAGALTAAEPDVRGTTTYTQWLTAQQW